MPIEYDKRPFSAQKRQKTKSGEIPPPVAPPVEPAPVPLMRVRILRRITNSRKFGTFAAGNVARLPLDKAKELLSMGLAEEDKSLDGPPETKS
jgi:hypothetical protein